MSDTPDLYGCLLGIAIGDSLGLPFEGLSAQKVGRRLRNKPLQQSLVLGKGMLSDDTEQACLILESAIIANGDSGLFQKTFARRLRAWFWAIPAGVGMATVKASLKLTFGVSPEKSGVDSAGNGAAMRAPILGAFLHQDLGLLESFACASSVVTHRDPRATDGAVVMAFSVRHSKEFLNGKPAAALLAALANRCETSEWKDLLDKIGADLDQTPQAFAERLGCKNRVSGYVMHSVPIALFTWLRNPADPAKGMEEIIRLGGDTDTTGAMLGALYGASLGEQAFPETWRNRIADWPRSRNYLRELAHSATQGVKPPKVIWLSTLPRNFFFLLVVLVHGFRRLAP